MTVLIGGAWPYANGSLHLGHLAALLPGDVLARYYRLKGEKVLYVSGSDCHGTPIALRAKAENRKAEEIADKYHTEFKQVFRELGFSYDLYTKTDDSFHHQKVKEIFKVLLNKNYIYKKETEQLYCPECDQYLEEGLIDRAVSRDLDWGIEVPIEGYSQKKIYVWVEAVLGYFTASQKWAVENNENWQQFWQENTESFYIHGKDNIPFHTIILPALLSAQGNLNLPDNIVSSEYLTIEGRKLSTSKNWAIWVKDLLQKYNPDTIRYYMIANAPEKRDSNFSWEEFVNNHNGELLAAFGNFVNRNLVFIEKYFDSRIPEARIDPLIAEKLKKAYNNTAEKIEKTRFKEVLEEIFALIRDLNKYFDQKEPWLSRRGNPAKCKETIYSCTVAIANLSNLLQPFLPFSSAKVKEILKIEHSDWTYFEPEGLQKINKVEILFERIDKERIEIERNNLSAQAELNE